MELCFGHGGLSIKIYKSYYAKLKKKNEAKLINIWRRKRNSRNLPAEIRRHHAIDVDPITQLQGYSHSKPAGAQPGVGTLPGRKEKLTIFTKIY